MTDAELADAPSPVLNRKVKSAAKQEARNLAFLDIDPKELARQMTLFDYQQFNKIRPWELLDNNFMKKETSPNIAFIADRFSQISRWIASELLTTPNSKQRAKIISQFISLAQRLVELQNFHTAHNLIAALSQTVVTNLKWDVSSSTMAKYATLEELFSPLGGFRHLRPIYESAKPPFIPPLNLLLKDLAMIEEGNPTYWKPPEEPDPNVTVPKNYDPEVKMINVLKIQMLGKIISNLQLAQEFKFVITPVPVIQEYLRSGLFCLSDQEFQNYKNRQKRISS
jgi:son of sevenless-like protein